MTENEDKGQPKKKGPGKGRWEYFKVTDNKIERIKKACPRCGGGTYLAAHKDRSGCGKCGYTEFTSSEKQAQKPQKTETSENKK